MNKSKIEWTDYTWNPITGCLHDCPYCYARKISKRFSGDVRLNLNDRRANKVGDHLFELENKWSTRGDRSISFPLGFEPTFHKYRLDWPTQKVTGSRVFVCSMADMFGDWIPDAWIEQIFAACEQAPQHQYLFLTKNPKRYIELSKRGILRNKDNFWYGSTITNQITPFFYSDTYHTFLSIEPILEPFDNFEGLLRITSGIDWIIIGAETGNRKDKPVPKPSWIANIVDVAVKGNIPVFMKDSLVSIVGEERMFRFFPEQMQRVVYSEALTGKLFARCAICGSKGKKSEMHTILNKEKRKEGAKVIGYICNYCYPDFEKGLNTYENN